MKVNIIHLIFSKLYIFNILLLISFLFIFCYRTLYILLIYNIILLIIKTSTNILFVSILFASCKPDNRLGKKLKSKILLFNNIKIFSIFTLLIKPLRRLIGFNFLFFGASSASPSIWAACVKPVLFSYEAPAGRVLSSYETPVGRTNAVWCPLNEFLIS